MRLYRGNDRPVFAGRTRPSDGNAVEAYLGRSGSRAASLFAEILDHEPEALIHDEFFEHLLPAERIVDECRGHEVREHFRVPRWERYRSTFSGNWRPFSFNLGVELEHFCAEGIGLDRWRRFGFERLDSSNRKGSALFEGVKSGRGASPARSSSRCRRARPTQARINPTPGDVKKIIGRFPLRSLRFYERDAEHPVLAQGVFQHFLVARLKNMERQQGVRKKKAPGSGMTGTWFRQGDGIVHGLREGDRFQHEICTQRTRQASHAFYCKMRRNCAIESWPSACGVPRWA